MMPPYHDIDWDDALEKTPEATALTTRGLLNVERWLKANARSTMFSLDLVRGIHRTIFEDVFPDFAGKLRGPFPPYLPIDVSFGNRRGMPHMEVPDACRKMARFVEQTLRAWDPVFQYSPPDADFDEEILKLAAYTHCELVKIHPFVNGNGRTARSCINYFCWRYGYRPIALERPGGEYIEANRTWMDRQRIEHMMDVLRPGWIRR